MVHRQFSKATRLALIRQLSNPCVRPQYNAVSAWVPASFAVPKLLPGLPAWMNMKKTKKTHAEPSDGEKPAFRQVSSAAVHPSCLVHR